MVAGFFGPLTVPHIWGAASSRPGAGCTRGWRPAVLLWAAMCFAGFFFVFYRPHIWVEACRPGAAAPGAGLVVLLLASFFADSRPSVSHACQAPQLWGKVRFVIPGAWAVLGPRSAQAISGVCVHVCVRVGALFVGFAHFFVSVLGRGCALSHHLPVHRLSPCAAVGKWRCWCRLRLIWAVFRLSPRALFLSPKREAAPLPGAPSAPVQV